MKNTNFCVGPSQLYTGVPQFYADILETGIGSISHRSKKFTDISKAGLECARLFFNIPENYKIFYTYSATESMELVVRGLIEKKSTHVVNGNFGNVWHRVAKHNGREAQKFETLCTHNSNKHEPVLLKNVLESLHKQPTENISDVICMTGHETASGIGYSPDEIDEFSEKIADISSDTLLAVDVTSGMGGVDYNFASADVWLFSVQKALGLPAGLGFLILSPKAFERAQKIEAVGKVENIDFGNHHAISALEKKMHEKYQTPTTPNVLAIAGFGFVCKSFLSDFTSIEHLAEITEEKANMYYDFFESEKNTSDFVPAIAEKEARTQTVIVIELKNYNSLSEEEQSEKMKKQMEKIKNAGFEVATGYGKLKTIQLRLANFPVHSKKDIQKILSCFEK